MAEQANEEPFLLFMHIPKTAGTTLRSIVDLQYGAEAVLTYYNQPNRQLLDNLPYVLMDRRRAYRALIGHFPFGVHEGLPRTARYVTFLRDPVERAISAYHEVMKTDPGRLADAGGRMQSVIELMENRPDEYANQQLRMLRGVAHHEPVTCEDVDRIEADFAEHFAFVGLLERFDESMLLLAKRLGWTACLYGRLNQRKSGSGGDPELRDALARHNSAECDLYARAERALDRMLAAEGELFDAALAELKGALALGAAGDRATFRERELPTVAAYLATGP